MVNARFVKPLDKEMLVQLAANHRIYVTIEENVLSGGFGQQVLDCVERERLDVYVHSFGIPDDYVEHGNVDVLRKEVGLEKTNIVEKIITDYNIARNE